MSNLKDVLLSEILKSGKINVGGRIKIRKDMSESDETVVPEAEDSSEEVEPTAEELEKEVEEEESEDEVVETSDEEEPAS